MTITRKMTIDFLKSLEKSGLIVKGSHKNEDILAAVSQTVALTDEQVAEMNKPSITFFNSEFSDWIETYQGK